MQTNSGRTFACATVAALLALCAERTKLIGAEDPAQDKKTVSLQLSVLPSATVITGKTVTISMDPKDLAPLRANAEKSKIPLHFQWRKNGEEIQNATKDSYTIANVGFEDAASYTLLLRGATEAETTPLHLSVYRLFSYNPNGGVMRTPIGDFTSQSNTICGATGWVKWKTYLPFDGPSKVPPVSADFPNTSNGNKLDVDTCSVTNGATIDTAIRVRENWGFMNQVCCDNDTACVAAGNSKLSKCVSVPLQTNQTYRVTIYLKNVGSEPHVTFNWLYHN